MNVRALLRPVRRLWPQKVRTRLTLIYAALFFATGAALLTLTYGLVASNLPTEPSPAVARISNQELNALSRDCYPLGGLPNGTKGKPANADLKALSGCKAAEGAYYAGTAAGMQALRQNTLAKLLGFWLLGLGVMTVASGGLGWFMAGRVLRPVRVITETARRASEQHLGERLALTGATDELKELADTFDGMLERLDAAFATQRRFVANASHEIERLDLRVDAELDPAETAGDPQLLERMVWNLVDNAVRHNEPGGWIRLRAGSSDAAAYLKIANSGPFIPDDTVPSLFEPFRRMEARTSARDGFGLGLSIARSVATAHGATFTARSQRPGGLDISVVIPRCPAAEPHSS
jgi:signal transduction histidine kinase